MLVYLISTGENVANVLPVLEFSAASDTLIWLESSRARSSGWTEGAIQVLKNRGFGNQIRLEVGENTEDLAKMAAEFASGRAEPIAIVANGGTKLQSLALYGALAGYSPKVLYNDGQSASYLVFHHGPTAAFERRLYQKTTIGLDEILACRGFARKADSGERIWPGVVPAQGGYGYDPVVTAEKHSVVAAWFADSFEDPPPMTWSSAQKLAPLASKKFRNTLLREFRSLFSWLNGPTRPEFTPGFSESIIAQVESKTLSRESELEAVIAEEFRILLDNCLEGMDLSPRAVARVFARAMRLDRDARSAWIHQGRTPPRESLGFLFERAVAMRVLDWLTTSSVQSAVAEIWSNVKVLGSERVIAELDIAFVMKNGVLLHLECKSFKADSKDLYARLFNLQNGTSRLAEMAICAPLYTDFTDELWFKDMHKMRVYIKRVAGFHFIPFTLPGQPREYFWREESFNVPSFEESLNRWLTRFIPASS